MKKSIIIGIVGLGLFVPQAMQGQGTLYISNLGQATTGDYAVGNDSWYATHFSTGNNASGYLLDSIALAMVGITGNPSGFTVMLYANSDPSTVLPGSNLGALDGSDNPSTADIYTYTPASSMTLLPNTDYFIALTSETAAVNGAYEWSLTDANSYNPSGGWDGSEGRVYTSNNGSSWIPIRGAFPQFAITATPIPESSSSFLLLLGGGVFISPEIHWQMRIS